MTVCGMLARRWIGGGSCKLRPVPSERLRLIGGGDTIIFVLRIKSHLIDLLEQILDFTDTGVVEQQL